MEAMKTASKEQVLNLQHLLVVFCSYAFMSKPKATDQTTFLALDHQLKNGQALLKKIKRCQMSNTNLIIDTREERHTCAKAINHGIKHNKIDQNEAKNLLTILTQGVAKSATH